MTESGTQAGGSWYYAIGQQRQGPVTAAEMKMLIASGQVSGGTLVWAEGMPTWIAAATHPELAEAIARPQGHLPQQGPSPYQPVSVPLGYYAPVSPWVAYGGFWLRFGAAFIDGLILL